MSKVDNRTKYSVYGWIRKAEKDLNLCHIPLMISNTVILYFQNRDTFGKIQKNIIKSKDDTRINLAKIGKFAEWYGGVGSIQIDSNNPCKYQWDLNVYTSSGRCVIGITSLNNLNDNICTGIWNEKGIHYLHCGRATVWRKESESDYGCWVEYGTSFEKGKVSIHLDLKKKEIRYSLNDKDDGIAYENIKTGKDVKYRLTVSLAEIHDFVEIENFMTL